jgi:hypothetical protein
MSFCMTSRKLRFDSGYPACFRMESWPIACRR